MRLIVRRLCPPLRVVADPRPLLTRPPPLRPRQHPLRFGYPIPHQLEQQLGLFADRTSCHAFLANSFRVLQAAAAYVLVEHIRRTALVGTALEKAEVGTIRLRLFRVAALVVTSVRRLVVRL